MRDVVDYSGVLHLTDIYNYCDLHHVDICVVLKAHTKSHVLDVLTYVSTMT